jgi:hypothetical protein
LGVELVNKVDGSELAKQRMQAILQTLSGELSVAQACERLQLSEARFHELRTQWLQSACIALEPKAVGRPAPPPPSEQELKIKQLEHQIKELRIDLRAAQIREELALVMPHVMVPRKGRALDRRQRLDEMQKEWDQRGIEKKVPTPSAHLSRSKNSTANDSGKSGKAST